MGKRARRFWALVEAERSAGSTTRQSLLASGREVYQPMYREAARRGIRRVLPLLDVYILVLLDSRIGWSDVRSMRGVRSIVRGADGGDVFAPPARVPDVEVETIRALEDEMGYVVVAGEEPPAFALNDLVEATTGMFRDKSGEYRGIDPSNSCRAQVAFSVIGCEIISSILRYDLRAS